MEREVPGELAVLSPVQPSGTCAFLLANTLPGFPSGFSPPSPVHIKFYRFVPKFSLWLFTGKRAH